MLLDFLNSFLQPPLTGLLATAVALLIACVILQTGPWSFSLWKNAEEPVVRRVSDPATCLKILQNLPYDDSLGANKIPHVVSRAVPNQRLVRAFQIDNGFTTSDQAYGRLFRTIATQQIRQDSFGGWRNIATVARDVASDYLEKLNADIMVRLDLMVQAVSLKVVLSTFFEVDHDMYTDDTAIFIAETINHLWIQSKSRVGSQAEDFALLRSRLIEVGLTWKESKENPLNIILPAYETLWRVVARCLIEIVFRPSADTEWLALLEDFRTRPHTETFSRSPPGDTKVSVAFLVNEALRLYPPTRRINRLVHYASQPKPEILAVDVEQCHRLTEIWGDDSDHYRPARWISANEDMRQAFMPFGCGPWICPASGSFGPMMIGVLVAAFASVISKEDWEFQMQSGKPDEGAKALDDATKLDSDSRENMVWEIVKRIE
ncbi:MAG: hypothetical protein Q9168_007889 [Polycauliona sp. 1 TL-2023]